MTAETPEQPGRVPVGELRALVEHFRDQHELTADETRGPIHGTPYGKGVSMGLDYAANELEERISKYERTREKIRCDNCGKPEFETWDDEHESEGLCVECRYEA